MVAIAKMLSEKGLVVSPVLLKYHVTHADSAGSKKKPRRKTQRREGRSQKASGTPTEKPASDPTASESKTTTAATAKDAVPAASPAATCTATSRIAPPERKSAFIPRNDTDDI